MNTINAVAPMFPQRETQKEHRELVVALCIAVVLALHIATLAWLTRPVADVPKEPPVQEITLIPVPIIEKPEPVVEKPKPIVKPKPVVQPIKAPLPPKPKAKATPKPMPVAKPKPVMQKPAETRPISPEAIEPMPIKPFVPTPLPAVATPRVAAPTAVAKPVSSSKASGSDRTDTNTSSNSDNQATTKPGYRYHPKPEYPASARSDHLEGTVKVKVRISADGIPEQVSIAVSSGYEVLDNAAVETVKDWRFTPAKKGDTPVATTATFPVSFKLQD